MKSLSIIYILLCLADLIVTITMMERFNFGGYRDPIENNWIAAQIFALAGYFGMICFRLSLMILVLAIVYYVYRYDGTFAKKRFVIYAWVILAFGIGAQLYALSIWAWSIYTC